jgi:hydroxymethylglutaryl-CoA lyase
MPLLPDRGRIRYPVLVPNERGMDRAIAAGADSLAVFTAASDAFTTRNIGMTIDESLVAFTPVLDRASQLGWWKRAYVSTAFGCPFTGAVEVAKVVDVSLKLLDLGADEICLGDTIGAGVPSQVHKLTAAHLERGVPIEKLAYHFHDTRGTALANVLAGLEDGITCFDSSTGGTGGCPYAPGAAGNLATEDLVYLLDGMNIEHGVDLIKILEAARFIAAALGKPLTSKVGQAGGWDSATGARTGV